MWQNLWQQWMAGYDLAQQWLFEALVQPLAFDQSRFLGAVFHG